MIKRNEDKKTNGLKNIIIVNTLIGLILLGKKENIRKTNNSQYGHNTAKVKKIFKIYYTLFVFLFLN